MTANVVIVDLSKLPCSRGNLKSHSLARLGLGAHSQPHVSSPASILQTNCTSSRSITQKNDAFGCFPTREQIGWLPEYGPGPTAPTTPSHHQPQGTAHAAAPAHCHIAQPWSTLSYSPAWKRESTHSLSPIMQSSLSNSQRRTLFIATRAGKFPTMFARLMNSERADPAIVAKSYCSSNLRARRQCARLA